MIAELVTDPVPQSALHAAAALLFLSAALHKWRDRSGFRTALAGYAMLPDSWVPASALAITAVEFAIAIACANPATAALGCAAGAALLGIYTAAVAFNLARGRRAIDCGCGGAGGERPLSPGLAARNAGLMALLALGALPESGRTLVWLDAVSIAGALLVLALSYAAADVAVANAARLAPRQEAT
jgi:hypothetical protein